MPSDKFDPTRKLTAAFRAGRISRRQFLAGLGVLAGGAALGAVPAVSARNSAISLSSVLRQAATATPKVMIYGGSQDVATIDPSDRTDYSILAISRQLYDRLFRFEDGWPQTVQPGLAQKWGVSDDAKEWTFTITDKAKFHDGSALSAQDVVYSFQRTLRAKKERSTLLAPYLAEDGIVAKDNTTVVMTLTTPYAAFDRLLAFLEQPIVSMAIAKAHDSNGDEGAAYLVDHEAGSGPFTIDDWEVGNQYSLKAVDDYWQGWPGDSHLSGVVWKKTEDVSTRKTGLLSGDFDVIDTVSTNDINDINNNASTVATVNYGLLAGYFKYNTQNGPTSDPNFRKFLSYSFDRKAFSDSQNGNVQLMIEALPQGVPGYDPNLQPQYSYDPDQAKKYLDMTQYKDGGFSLDFMYVSGLDFEEAGGTILLNELQKYNITLNMVPKSFPDIVGACNAPSTGPAIGFIFDQYPPLADTWLIGKYSSKSWDRPTGGSFQSCSFYKNADVDKALDQLATTTDATAAGKLVEQVLTQVATDAPDMPLYVSPNILGFNKNVKGYKYYGDISVDFWRLWIDDSASP